MILSMKKIICIFILLLSACVSVTVPDEFARKDVPTNTFTIATWQKIAAADAPYHIYIEGDGHAFNSRGMPTDNPTPHGTFMRELAFGDTSPNVIYLARPCQFVDEVRCEQKYWTTARFSHDVIDAEYHAIKEIVGNAPVILIGYSGGAQVAGLVAVTKDLNVKKLVTIAGNLDHRTWTASKNFVPLSDSLSLTDYKIQYLKIPQTHYVGARDTVIPFQITIDFVGPDNVIILPDATHASGFDGKIEI